MADEAFRTAAWQLIGITQSVPGVLEMADGRLGFTTGEGTVFDVPRSEVTDIQFPWYYFGGGVKLKAGAERYRLSFVRPNDASDIPGRLLGGAAGVMTAGRKILDIGQGRAAGKAWRGILTRNG